MNKFLKIMRYIPIIIVIVGGLLIFLLTVLLLNSIISVVRIKFTNSMKCNVHIIECLDTCNNRKICSVDVTLTEPNHGSNTNNIHLLNIPRDTKDGQTVCYFYGDNNLALDSWQHVNPILNRMKALGSAIATISIIVAVFGILPIIFVKCLNRMNLINTVGGLF